MENEIKVNESNFKLSVLGAVGIAILYCVIINQIIGVPFYFLLKIKYFISDRILNVLVQIIGYLIPKFIIVILILNKIRKEYKSDFKIKFIEKFNVNLLLCTIFLVVGLYLCLQGSILPELENLPMAKFVEEGIKEAGGNLYLRIALPIIAGPIIEEILIRGIILEGLLNKNKPVTAIIVSSVIFGAIHLNIPQFISATIGGILYGYIYYKTKSLSLCIVAHMIRNTIAYFNINSSIITFFIGVAILLTSLMFFNRNIERLEFNDTNNKQKSI